MRGCHSCPVADEIAAGVYDCAAWDEVPCATCDLDSQTRAAAYYEESEAGDETDERPGVDDGVVLPITVMGEVLKGLLLLPAVERDTVAMRYSGMKYADIAKAQGVSMGCAEKRHRTAMLRWPVLRNLFPLKMQKQKKRAAKKADID